MSQDEAYRKASKVLNFPQVSKHVLVGDVTATKPSGGLLAGTTISENKFGQTAARVGEREDDRLSHNSRFFRLAAQQALLLQQENMSSSDL